MDLAIKVIALVSMCILLFIFIWGFVLFYRYIIDVRKQNIMLFSILDRLDNEIKEHNSTKSAEDIKQIDDIKLQKSPGN